MVGFGNEIGVQAGVRVDDTDGTGAVTILVGVVVLR
jgi:hypothetical protein